jgi:hypothetical protein
MKIGLVLRKVSKKRRRKRPPRSSELRPGSPRARRSDLTLRVVEIYHPIFLQKKEKHERTRNQS